MILWPVDRQSTSESFFMYEKIQKGDIIFQKHLKTHKSKKSIHQKCLHELYSEYNQLRHII